MTKHYQELIPNLVFIGGAASAEEVAKTHEINKVFDLRAESSDEDKTGKRVHLPIIDDADKQDDSVKTAIRTVKKEYDQGNSVYFHCSGGKNRTGTVAIGLLLELGLAHSIKEAEEKAVSIRPEISIKPEMKETLGRLYN
ncbi:protein-tyrosine phosphatase family protein [Shouchella shacheensis]|uniref:protein-tyrosine phosphatase family protein n=1 Tax=Shouchella shacheensis TaxID=1649580 RepID=UPI00073FD85A|nr:tyrosine-protein phosphatase [Shouchella shacheensis]